MEPGGPRLGSLLRAPPNRMLKNFLFRRLLKKAQLQGGARREAYLVRTSQRRASAPTPHPLPQRQRGEMLGLFQQPAKASGSNLVGTA